MISAATSNKFGAGRVMRCPRAQLARLMRCGGIKVLVLRFQRVCADGRRRCDVFGEDCVFGGGETRFDSAGKPWRFAGRAQGGLCPGDEMSSGMVEIERPELGCLIPLFAGV